MDEIGNPETIKFVAFAELADTVDGLRHRVLAVGRACRSRQFLHDVVFESHAPGLGFGGKLRFDLWL